MNLRGRARFISVPIKECVALRLVRPVCSEHKMSRDLWQEEPFVAEASSDVGVKLLGEGGLSLRYWRNIKKGPKSSPVS